MSHRLPPEHHLLFLSTPDNPDLPSPIYSQNGPARGTFLPACPMPWVVQPHERIEWLKERLKESKNERQKPTFWHSATYAWSYNLYLQWKDYG